MAEWSAANPIRVIVGHRVHLGAASVAEWSAANPIRVIVGH